MREIPRSVSIGVRVVVIAAAVFAAGQRCCASEPVVYFQVSYASGDVRDLNRVPVSRDGILGVTRITRVEQAPRGATVLSTEGPAVRTVNSGRTSRAELTWNGKAWVGPRVRTEPATSRPTTVPAPGPARIEELQKLATALGELRGQLPKYAKAMSDAEKKLAAAGDTDKKQAVDELATARALHDNCVKAIGRFESALVRQFSLADSGDAAPSGVLSRSGGPPTKGTLGIARPVEETGVLAHRVQVWPLPPGQGERTYTIAVAHPEAGVFGGFHYVAYADTDGDGTPDKLIARSSLATAQKPGEWTSWTFTTSQPRVFAGHTWQRSDTTHYRGKRKRRDRDDDWLGLPDEIYVSGYFGGVPGRRHKFWPYLHNIRVRLRSEDEDRDDPADRSKIITRQRP